MWRKELNLIHIYCGWALKLVSLPKREDTSFIFAAVKAWEITRKKLKVATAAAADDLVSAVPKKPKQRVLVSLQFCIFCSFRTCLTSSNSLHIYSSATHCMDLNRVFLGKFSILECSLFHFQIIFFCGPNSDDLWWLLFSSLYTNKLFGQLTIEKDRDRMSQTYCIQFICSPWTKNSFDSVWISPIQLSTNIETELISLDRYFRMALRSLSSA